MLKRIYRYLARPAVLRRIQPVDEREPRRARRSEHRRRVSVSGGSDDVPGLKNLCRSIVPDWDRNDRVLIKINLNTADPSPASTDPAILSAFLDAMGDAGFRKLIVGDCASNSAVPTKRTAIRSGVAAVLRGKARPAWFDRRPWVRVTVGGDYLSSIVVPRLVFEVDRIVHLANMKTHIMADFSFGMKLGIGYMHPLERRELHRNHLKEKVAETALAVEPDLTVVDGRKAFVSGGPVEGRVEEAGIVIWGEHPLAVDVETYRRLYALKKRLGCLEEFTEDPFDMIQLGHARQIGVGGDQWREYDLVEV